MSGISVKPVRLEARDAPKKNEQGRVKNNDGTWKLVTFTGKHTKNGYYYYGDDEYARGISNIMFANMRITLEDERQIGLHVDTSNYFNDLRNRIADMVRENAAAHVPKPVTEQPSMAGGMSKKEAVIQLFQLYADFGHRRFLLRKICAEAKQKKIQDIERSMGITENTLCSDYLREVLGWEASLSATTSDLIEAAGSRSFGGTGLWNMITRFFKKITNLQTYKDIFNGFIDDMLERVHQLCEYVSGENSYGAALLATTSFVSFAAGLLYWMFSHVSMQQVGRLLLVAGSTILQMARIIVALPFTSILYVCAAVLVGVCMGDVLPRAFMARHRSALTEIVEKHPDCAIARLTGKNGGQDCTGFEQALRDCDVHETDEELRNYLLHGAPVPVVVARVTGTG